MNEEIYVPLFPLRIMPLPGELIPLHIFEPRYRQLLDDVEGSGLEFGILSTDPSNIRHFGTMVRLEQVIRRHREGSSDIIVRGGRFFSVLELNRFFPGKGYPGGRVEIRRQQEASADLSVRKLFERFQQSTSQYQRSGEIDLYEMAVALGLSVPDRLRLISGTPEFMKSFLRGRITLELELAEASERAKDIFHLN